MQKLKQELAKAAKLHFENGDVEKWNPDLGIEEQAELLPYDKRWEFPRNKLKLGIQKKRNVKYIFDFIVKKTQCC